MGRERGERLRSGNTDNQEMSAYMGDLALPTLLPKAASYPSDHIRNWIDGFGSAHHHMASGHGNWRVIRLMDMDMDWSMFMRAVSFN